MLTECIPLFQILYGSDERQCNVYSVHQHKNEPLTDFTIEFELINLFDRCHCPTNMHIELSFVLPRDSIPRALHRRETGFL